MEWLNYHHLLYFWTVAREGSVTKASRLVALCGLVPAVHSWRFVMPSLSGSSPESFAKGFNAFPYS